MQNDYARRMEENWAFKEFKVRPKWTPRQADVAGFIHDECVRQGWDPRTPDGKRRIRWMTHAWEYAVERSARSFRPDLDDLLHIAYEIEPGENFRGYRRIPIFVGNETKVDWRDIPRMVSSLWNIIMDVEPITGRSAPDEPMTADDFYVEFENIHPFGDGNGRTGKIIHNWILGTLRDPVLVRDYFKGGNP
jgi:hypothetical protein